MTRRDYLRERYKQDRKAGLCTMCRTRASREGKAQCAECSDYIREKYKARRLDGKCTECKTPSQYGKSRCDECLRKMREYHKRNAKQKYIPLDVWREQPRNRLVRALRWFDWVEFSEVADALGAPEGDANARTGLYNALKRLVDGGQVERRRVRTFRGRHVVEFRLKRGVTVTPPNDDSVCADKEAA